MRIVECRPSLLAGYAAPFQAEGSNRWNDRVTNWVTTGLPADTSRHTSMECLHACHRQISRRQSGSG